MQRPDTAVWRLLITPPADGATNMAIDEAILHALADGDGRPTLRFYRWEPPCLSLGYNQRAADADEAACRALGYTWVRRPTGGRAILHTNELT
ncbi:MAG: biotin/lipoate A/B protein ligase family protein, partial [Anaerolineae bacterium]